VLELPLSLHTRAETHTHRKRVRDGLCCALGEHGFLKGGYLFAPVLVTITRVAPGTLTARGLEACTVYVRYGVADALYCRDADKRIVWRYAQTRGAMSAYGLRVEVTRCSPTGALWTEVVS
jgi:hypothetical protein